MPRNGVINFLYKMLNIKLDYRVRIVGKYKIGLMIGEVGLVKCAAGRMYVQSSARAVRYLSIDCNITDGFVLLHKFLQVLYM
jgi:hypothetical protein